jgi:uncharacterized protein
MVGLLWIAAAADSFALTGPQLAAEFDRGLNAYDAQQYESAYQIWWHIKDQDLAAMRNVALMLRKGQGVPKNARKAEDLLKTAAADGMPNAQVDLAEMYLNGEVGVSNPSRAVPLLQEAADAGHPLGQFLLGQIYEEGASVPKNMAKATELYIAAARGGLHEAKERLASLGRDQPDKPGQSSNKVASAGPVVNQQQTAPAKQEAATSVYVQLGSFKSIEAAEAQWMQLKRLPVLALAVHKVDVVDLGQKGVWHRLLVSYQDRAAAIASCDQVKASGKACLIRSGSDPG